MHWCTPRTKSKSKGQVPKSKSTCPVTLRIVPTCPYLCIIIIIIFFFSSSPPYHIICIDKQPSAPVANISPFQRHCSKPTNQRTCCNAPETNCCHADAIDPFEPRLVTHSNYHNVWNLQLHRARCWCRKSSCRPNDRHLSGWHRYRFCTIRCECWHLLYTSQQPEPTLQTKDIPRTGQGTHETAAINMVYVDRTRLRHEQCRTDPEMWP